MRKLISKFVCSGINALGALALLTIVVMSCGDDDEQPEIITDIDGNEYLTVTIGNQVWTSENLKVTKYNDGTDIPYVTDNDDVSTLTTGAFSYYGKNAANRFTYGALYNWFAISSGKLCPSGWHVPSDSEWTTLINFLGGEGVSGGKLKETGTTHWSAPNTGATNESGFTAVPSGYLYNNSTYHSLGNVGHWWTATESGTDSAWDRYVYFQNASATTGEYSKQVLYSCRCLKD